MQDLTKFSLSEQHKNFLSLPLINNSFVFISELTLVLHYQTNKDILIDMIKPELESILNLYQSRRLG